MVINQARLDAFMALYTPALAKAMADHPDEYMPGLGAEGVALKMRAAIERGSANKDGRAFKATCKQLGIKQTYKEIYAYLAG